MLIQNIAGKTHILKVNLNLKLPQKNCKLRPGHADYFLKQLAGLCAYYLRDNILIYAAPENPYFT